VRALLATVQLPGGEWFEPAVGDGAIVKAVNEIRQDIRWTISDKVAHWIDPIATSYFNLEFGSAGVHGDKSFRVVITNPPFSQALEFVQGAMKDGKIVVMLLRLNWLASQKRNRFLLDLMEIMANQGVSR